MSSQQYLKWWFIFLILTDLMSFLLSFVLWSFQVLGKDLMDYGIRSRKSLSLGMPKAPQAIFKDTKKSKLGDAPEGIPSFVFNPSVNLLEAIFLFTTWYVFCLSVLYDMSLWFLVCHNHPCCTHLLRGTRINREFIRILYVLHLYLLS